MYHVIRLFIVIYENYNESTFDNTFSWGGSKESKLRIKQGKNKMVVYVVFYFFFKENG